MYICTYTYIGPSRNEKFTEDLCGHLEIDLFVDNVKYIGKYGPGKFGGSGFQFKYVLPDEYLVTGVQVTSENDWNYYSWFEFLYDMREKQKDFEFRINLNVWGTHTIQKVCIPPRVQNQLDKRCIVSDEKTVVHIGLQSWRNSNTSTYGVGVCHLDIPSDIEEDGLKKTKDDDDDDDNKDNDNANEIDYFDDN